MGIQSSRFISREEAENKYIAILQDEQERFLRVRAVALTDTELENKIEEHFFNYIITQK